MTTFTILVTAKDIKSWKNTAHLAWVAGEITVCRRLRTTLNTQTHVYYCPMWQSRLVGPCHVYLCRHATVAKVHSPTPTSFFSFKGPMASLLLKLLDLQSSFWGRVHLVNQRNPTERSGSPVSKEGAPWPANECFIVSGWCFVYRGTLKRCHSWLRLEKIDRVIKVLTCYVEIPETGSRYRVTWCIIWSTHHQLQLFYFHLIMKLFTH